MFNEFDECLYCPFECPFDDYYRSMPPSPPPFGGSMQNQGGNTPKNPPPTFTPSKSKSTSLKSAGGSKGMGGPNMYAVNPGSIKPCKYRYVYLWLDNGREFWAWLTFVGSKSVSGYRWTGYRWVYFGVDLNKIDSFECY